MESKSVVAMVRNTGSNWVLKEEDESIELDLGLSVGGSYSRQNGAELSQGCIRSSVSSCFEEKDQKTKREIHALRRQEAKKKREEKQLKRGFSKSVNNGVSLNERECKKMKKEKINGSDHCNVNLNFTVHHQIDGMSHKIGTCYAAPPPCNSLPGQPVENGFVYPCGNVMPCWFAGGGAEEKNGVKIQPVVGYGFVPLDLDHGLGNGYGSEENCSGDGGNRKSGSNGSTNCTSSTGSDHRSSYNEGGGSNSSYTRSHSSPSAPQQPQLNGSKANDAKSHSHSEHTAISNLSESTSADEGTYNNAANVVPTNSSNSSPTGAKGQAKSEAAEADPYPLSGNKLGSEKKPPKPLSHDQTTPPIPYMPCVSTTGNGPNGKTVNGFLYRYTKTDVSIICVCHGSSFSPAEFVQHAGGTDILNPLRHITVIPSAF